MFSFSGGLRVDIVECWRFYYVLVSATSSVCSWLNLKFWTANSNYFFGFGILFWFVRDKIGQFGRTVLQVPWWITVGFVLLAYFCLFFDGIELSDLRSPSLPVVLERCSYSIACMKYIVVEPVFLEIIFVFCMFTFSFGTSIPLAPLQNICIWKWKGLARNTTPLGPFFRTQGVSKNEKNIRTSPRAGLTNEPGYARRGAEKCK